MPKVSIIVPSFNHGDFLEQRIKSIQNQTFTDFEIFLLDDCSTDNSWQIIEKYKSDVKVTHTHKNDINSGSPFMQWQYGIDLAKGQYIWIAESDDFAEPDFLEKSLKVLESDQSIGVVFCPSIWVDSNSEIINSPTHETEPFIENGSDLIKNEFTKGCLIYNASSAIFNKNLLKNVNFETIKEYKFTGDWLFWVQLIANTKVARLPDKLNYFRRHENNVSSKSNRKGLQFSEGYSVVEYIYKQHHLNFIQKRKINMFWALKVAENQDIDKKIALNLLPPEIGFWYKLIPILKLIHGFIK
jgi:glycosyltransferase involved in cell wall biosynthesis